MSNDTVKVAISDLCEYCIKTSIAGYESIVPQSAAYFLIQALDVTAKVADVKRLYNMRHCFRLIDYDNESSSSMKQLLVHGFVNATFLRCLDGKKFLIFLFELGEVIVNLSHQVILNQIPHASKSILDTFGDIYYKAWKNSTEECKMFIEYNCIQDLMNRAAHGHGKSTGNPLKKLRVILDCFHMNKKEHGVDEMLARLYEPIIWRSLSVANSHVRNNATKLLIDAFPIQNPDSSSAEIDEIMQKHFDHLETLIKDPSVQVRKSAIHGVCKIFAIYWEVIPKSVLGEFLNFFSSELAFDFTSFEVRSSVIQGFKYLLDHNTLCHASMKRHLIKIGRLIHDSNSKNRENLIELLLSVKSIPEIKFWEITDLKHILYRLEMEEHEKIRILIVQLVQNSFFPQKKSVDHQFLRALHMIETNVNAARCFYQVLSSQVPVEKVMLFFAYSYKRVHIQLTDGSSTKDIRFEIMLDCLALLLGSVYTLFDLDQYRKQKNDFIKLFTEHPIVDLLVSCKSEIGSSAVCDIAKYGLCENMASLAAQFQKLLFDGSTTISHVQKSVLECLIFWGIGDKILSEMFQTFEKELANNIPYESLMICNHHLQFLNVFQFFMKYEEYRSMIISPLYMPYFKTMSISTKTLWKNFIQGKIEDSVDFNTLLDSMLRLVFSYHVFVWPAETAQLIIDLLDTIIYVDFLELAETERKGKRSRESTVYQMLGNILESAIEVGMLKKGTPELYFCLDKFMRDELLNVSPELHQKADKAISFANVETAEIC